MTHWPITAAIPRLLRDATRPSVLALLLGMLALGGSLAASGRSALEPASKKTGALTEAPGECPLVQAERDWARQARLTDAPAEAAADSPAGSAADSPAVSPATSPAAAGVRDAENSTRAAVAGKRPNLILLLFDDLDAVVTPPYFAEVLPTLMKEVAQGLTFTEAFAPTPICCPARTTLLTGLLGHNTGVLTNGGKLGGYGAFMRNGNERRTVALALQKGGYLTALVGKYMNGYHQTRGKLPPIPAGWDEWSAFVDPLMRSYTGYQYRLLDKRFDAPRARVKRYGKRPQDYSTDVLRDRALDFLTRAESQDDRPFFLMLTPTSPHYPLQAAPRHAQKAQKWRNTLPTDRPNYFTPGESLAHRPMWLKQTWKKRTSRTSKNYLQLEWYRRMGSLYAMDELFSALVARLKALGEWENTLLMVTSDNGYNLGAHGLQHKMAPYEESIRVPFWVMGGALEKGAAPQSLPRSDAHWITLADVAPTWLELAGIPLERPLDGRSLAPLLAGQAVTSWRSDFLIQYAGRGAGDGIAAEMPRLALKSAPAVALDIPEFVGLRAQVPDPDGRARVYTYVEWVPVSNRRGKPIFPSGYELYDLTADPWEQHNLLYTDPARADRLGNLLHERLLSLAECRGESCW